MNKKIKILFESTDNAGVIHFRLVWPAQEMQKTYPDEFFVEINQTHSNDINYYKQFDIIHFHREFGPHDTLKSRVEELRKNGTIVIMDLDDYWIPEKTHPMYLAAITEKMPEKTISAFKNVDWVTTTTDIFASHISKHNKNVQVLPNALDLNHRMWKDVDTRVTDKVRISYIGGSSHMADLQLLTQSMNMLHNDKDLKDKYQIVMCGYDVRGFMTELDNDGKFVGSRKISPAETIWNRFEEVLTDNYNPNVVDADYKKWLLKYVNEEYKPRNVYEGNYVRRWTLPLTRYGEHYNYCDVSLAPLVENTFNLVKSQLKIVESGLKNKVLIAQDFAIYKELIENGKNGILVNKKNNTRGWYEAIKKVILDKEYREMLASNLHEFAKERYTLDITTKDRVEFYKKLIEDKNSSLVNKEKEASIATTI